MQASGPKSLSGMGDKFMGLGFRIWGLGGLGLRVRRTPPPRSSGIIEKSQGPNIITVMPYSHHFRVGGPPKLYALAVPLLEQLLSKPCF